MTPPIAGLGTRTGHFPQSALWPERSQAGARARSALPLAWPGRAAGSEPAEFAMVRRRSTVRFRKGAPRSEAGSDQGIGLFDLGAAEKCSNGVPCRRRIQAPRLVLFRSRA